MAHTLDPRAAIGLQNLQVWVIWTPDVGLPSSVQVYPAPADVQSNKISVNIYDQLETTVSVKIPLSGSARTNGKGTARLWLWNETNSNVLEAAVGLFLDDCVEPCGELKNGRLSVAIYAPDSGLATRYLRSYMQEQLGNGPWWSIQFPRVNWPDGIYRLAHPIIAFDKDQEVAMQKAWNVVLSPSWRYGKDRWFGAPHQINTAYGAQHASIDRTRWQQFTFGTETDPWDDWKYNKNTGSSGMQERFGVCSMPGLQQGMSDYAADLYRGLNLRVEGLRPTWLDQLQSDSTQRAQGGKSTHQFYSLYHLTESRVGRTNWSQNKLLNYGDYHGWTGPNVEHHWSELGTLAGLIRCPVTRDIAIWFARRACTSWSSHGFYEGGHYNGETRPESRRGVLRPWSTIALGWHVAKQWGLEEEAQKLHSHIEFKMLRMVTEPLGYRDSRDWRNNPIPYAHTAGGFMRIDTRLTADDIAGTPLALDNYPLERHVTEPWWQTMAVGPALLWALKTQNVHALTMIRDMQWQVVESFLVGDPNDPLSYKIAKCGSPRFLGIGMHWQDGTLQPAAYGQTIEHWLLEVLGIPIFDNHGVDGLKRQKCYEALSTVNPSIVYGDWGTDPSEWQQLGQQYGVPTLLPVCEGKRQIEWRLPI